MSSKKNTKQYTYESLCAELDVLQQSNKTDAKKISDIFGRIQDIKSLKNAEMESLFYKVINISGKEAWAFLLETYSRFYNRTKVKKQKEIIQLIEIEIKNRLASLFTPSDIDAIITATVKNGSCTLLEEKFDKIEGFCKEQDYFLQEVIAYIYIYLLVVAKKRYPSNDSLAIKLEKALFLRFGKGDKNDPLFVKDIKKALFDGKYAEKFMEITHLYSDIDNELAQLRIENDKNKELVRSKSVKIGALNEEVLHLSNKLARKNQEVVDYEEKIKALAASIKKLEDRNEYDENLYKQQFVSLKRNLVEQLKKDLELEIEGLEDIADTLNDIQKEKVQRRIARIYKAIQKIGE